MFEESRQAIRSKRVSQLARTRLAQAITGKLVTAETLRRNGVDVPVECPKCCEGQDSVFHRCWECPFSHDIRHKVAPQRMREQAVNQGRWHPLYGAGIAIDAQPDMRPNGNCEANWFVDDSLGNWCDNTYFGSVLGKVYTDGSAKLADSAAHAHAGWAAVQLFPDGTVAKAVYGTVPKELLQDSGMAEHVAWFKAAYFVQGGGVTIVTDCDGVQRGATASMKAAAGPRKIYGGVWKVAREHRAKPACAANGKGPSGSGVLA